MMRKYSTLLFLLITSACFGQIGGIDSVKINPFPNKSTKYIGVLTFDKKEKSKVLFLNADHKTKMMSDVISLPYEPYRYFVCLEGATTINLQADFKTDSLKNYRYTVIRTHKDGSKTGSPDLTPKLSKGNKGIFGQNVADFGTYNITDEIIKFGIYKLGKEIKEYEVIVYNKSISPAKITEANFVKIRAPKVERTDLGTKKDTVTTKANETTKTTTITSNTTTTDQSEYTSMDVKGGVIDLDSTRSYVDFSIASVENLFLYHILIKRSFEGKIENTFLDNLNWMPSTKGDFRIWLPIKDFTKPGKYELIVYPKIGPVNVNNIENATSIKFELRAETPSTYKDWIFPVIVGAICGGLAVYMKSRHIKKRIKEESRNKEMAQMQLNSVRSQLNPHFMFNALAGIQSLMNEKKTDEANQYLGKFSRLTRNVLNNKELISLAEEKTLLDDYLQMEQLRFGFNYQINIQPDVDLNIEIPAMLLQPFVENAVKHGIAEKGKFGEIDISFAKNDKNLMLELRDNGKGFDTSKSYDGFGLKLSQNRIVLLNSIYKENNIILDMNADENGTMIMITLKEWL